VWLHYGLGLSFDKCAALLARLGIEVTAGALSQAAQTTGTDRAIRSLCVAVQAAERTLRRTSVVDTGQTRGTRRVDRHLDPCPQREGSRPVPTQLLDEVT